MASFRIQALVAAISLSGWAAASDVRTIALRSHSLFPDAPAGEIRKADRNAGSLKPGRPASPEPILVDRTASIGKDGRLVFGCGTTGLHDFRMIRGTTAQENGL